VDGISIKNVLENPNYELNRESIFWHYPLENPHFLGGTSSGAIRSGDWKLIEFFDDQRLELYNLKYDRSESLDVADFHPIKTKELFELLQKWRASLNFKNSN
jgi:arylsulfatase A-like enzyme